MFQGNYFGKGNTTTYDRGQFHPVTAPETTFTKYAVNWTQETTTWLINDAPVRTLNFADAVGGKNYPQTPMNIRFGNWVAGSPGNSAGTIEWAGGLTDFSKGPFNMVVQSVKVINYNPATSYAYKDMSGSFQSIEILNAPAQASVNTSSGSGSSNSTGPGEVPFASTSGFASGSAASGVAAAAAATSGSGAKPSVVSINLGGASGQGQAAAAATKSPCSTINGTAAQGQAAAAATGAGKPSVVSINVGSPSGGMGPGAAAATAMAGASNSTTSAGQGIVAAGVPATNGTLPTVTINAGSGAGSSASNIPQGVTGAASTLTTAPAAGASTAAAVSGGTSFGIGSSTASAQPQQVTTNAGTRLEMGGIAVAAFAGLMAAW